MSTSPQPTQPPVPPQAPRSGSPVLAIVLLVLALIILLSGVAIWTGLRLFSQAVQVRVQDKGSGRKEVSIKTPVGGLEVAKDVDAGRLGLPIYPGAKQINDYSGTINMEFGGEEGFRLGVAKFETADPLGKVMSFYKKRLGHEVTKFVEKDSEGKTVFEIKSGGNEKIVTLKDTFSGTRIELVRVAHGHSEAN